jgi:hypothetical protein
MSKLFIEPHEAKTALWIKIKAHMESRLDVARKQNDSNLDAVQTANMRGRITELKSFLALDIPPPSITAGDE